MAVTACARIHLLAGRWTSTRGQVHGGTHATLSLYPFGLSTPTFPRLHALRGSRTLPPILGEPNREVLGVFTCTLHEQGRAMSYVDSVSSALCSSRWWGDAHQIVARGQMVRSPQLRAVFWSKTSTLIIDCNASTPQSPFLCIPHHIDREK